MSDGGVSGGEAWTPVRLGSAGAVISDDLDPIEALRRQGFHYPEERAAVANLQTICRDWSGQDAIDWGLRTGTLVPEDLYCAEEAETWRCPFDCGGCPDARSNTKRAIDAGLIPRVEPRADLEMMLERIALLRELGVRHFMNVGGTIDKFLTLTEQIKFQLEQGLIVSWFTDGVPQLDVNGQATELLTANLNDGWIHAVATHVSFDYLHGDCPRTSKNLFADSLELPPMQGGGDHLATDYARRHKSQYSAVLAKRLIEKNVRRVVANTTVSHANVAHLKDLYKQAVALQDYAEKTGSPTEVLFTFSPWVWRSHQARGDEPADHRPEEGLHASDMPIVSEALLYMLEDTYDRIGKGRPRIFANSSGYALLHADPAYAETAVWQAVPYLHGKAEIPNLAPSGDVMLDPQFFGPELVAAFSTFGYRDRHPNPHKNPFTQFHNSGQLYLPNIIASQTRQDENMQPLRMTG